MSSDGWATFEHAGAGLGIRFPDLWEVTRDAAAGVPLVAVEPSQEEGFRANVVVTVDELAKGSELRDWQRERDQRLPETLPGYFLLDLGHVLVAGLPGVRRLAHYAAPGPEAVTMQQWATVAEGRGYMVTASVATLAYASVADDLAAMAESFTVPGPRTAEETC